MPRREACRLLTERLGLKAPVSVQRLMSWSAKGLLKVRAVGGPKKPRYFVCRCLIKTFLSQQDGGE